MPEADAVITVYLDTSFYVDLERADAEKAEAATLALGRLGVRPVLSNALIHELLLHRTTSTELVDRIDRLPAPLRIPEEASWDDLRLDGDERTELTETTLGADRSATLAMSLSLSADRLSPAEGKIVMERAGVPTEAGPEQQAAASRLMQNALDAMEPGLSHFRRSSDPSAVELVRVFDRLLELLRGPFPFEDPTELLAGLAELMAHPLLLAADRESKIAATLSKNDRRVLDHALATPKATPKTYATLASLRRDARHMHVFLENLDQIDYLQIDGVRLKQMQHDEKHDLRVRGVDTRCFAAAGLDAVIEELGRRSRRS